MKELNRLTVLNAIEAGKLMAREAAQLLGTSLRQVRRLLANYRLKGAAGLAHGNRGRPSPQRLPHSVQEQILQLVRTCYLDYNDQHCCEELAEKHGIHVSRSTLRRLRKAAGLGSPRKRRAPRHRRRRERYTMIGMLLQLDASIHDWLEGRGPRLALLVAIDDATSEIVWAIFRYQEDTAGYYELMRHICQTVGRPVALYADRHMIFQSPKEETLEDQLLGKQSRSQFGRLVEELGIQLIAARSPQGKGRVERAFRTLQDRLVKALREAGAATLEEANRVLVDYIPKHNQRFAVPAAQPGSAFRTEPGFECFEQRFCFTYERTVANNNTVSFAGHILQIPSGPKQRSYARARVRLHQHLDGHVTIHYQDKQIARFDSVPVEVVRIGQFTPAVKIEHMPKDADVSQHTNSDDLPARAKWKPAEDHPWRHKRIGLKDRARVQRE